MSLVLAGCGGPPEAIAPGNTSGSEVASGTPAQDPVERIECGSGDGAMARSCTVDRTSDSDGELLTIRQPDGGFRRLRVAADGRTIRAADGAEEPRVLGRDDEGVEVLIGDARYRLPTR